MGQLMPFLERLGGLHHLGEFRQVGGVTFSCRQQGSVCHDAPPMGMLNGYFPSHSNSYKKPDDFVKWAKPFSTLDPCLEKPGVGDSWLLNNCFPLVQSLFSNYSI